MSKPLSNIKLSRRTFLKMGGGLAAAAVVARYGLLSPDLLVKAAPSAAPLMGKIKPADRIAAAQRAAKARAAAAANPAVLKPQLTPGPGSVPDYFGIWSNYALSQLPASVSIIGDGLNALATVAVAPAGTLGLVTMLNSGSGYTLAATTVTIVGGGGTGAIATPTIDLLTGAITAITIAGGTGYNTVPGIRKFVDTIAGLTAAGVNNLGQYIPAATPDIATYVGADYYEIGLVEYSGKMHSDLPATKLRGYVQIDPTKANPLFQLFYPGGVAPILDSAGGTVFGKDLPHYLGPAIVAQRNRPVRIKFTNFLPTGLGGNLFIPTDTEAMGAGLGPDGVVTKVTVTNPLVNSGYNSTTPPAVTFSGGGGAGAKAVAVVVGGRVVKVKITNEGTGYTTAPTVTIANGSGTRATATAAVVALGSLATYVQNRAVLHLHGGVTPWISDGTPHQWTTPVGENAIYPEGTSVQLVPDMPDPGPGSLTFFYSNQQSARLMFYHDHAYGTTRLNVYVGEAAAYLVRDTVEAALITAGTIPAAEIPLVIQDRTFVPDPNQLAAQDPTWNWGAVGGLWFPHTYMTNQNPYDPTGANAMGRWDYGPWFWPPFVNLTNGPLPNPYFVVGGAEPPVIPGTPLPSQTPESYMDTPMINGTVYPVLNVNPQPYRFRILNAANDRFWNLQMYLAASNKPMWNLVAGVPTTLADGDAGEVPMVPAVATPGFPAKWPTDGRAGGVPDPAAAGPKFIQIGTEGGFLPAPVVLDNQPVGYNYNRRDIVVLNIQDKTLLLGPAERADVIVDFSQYAGKTIIMYSDAPTPVPAFDPRTDYYTGDPDQTSTGGAPTTLPGYGPNTRTLMQIKVASVAVGGDALTSVTVTNGGADYQTMPLVVFSGGGAAAVQATATATGAVETIALTNAGAGYTVAPTVAVAAPGGTGVTATAVAVLKNGAVSKITVTNGGSGYTASPLVTFTGAATTPAAANATLTVTAVTLLTFGSGYTLAPDVDLMGGSGYGALATANLPLGATPFNLAALNTAWASTATVPGVFAADMDPIIVPQAAYNSAYAKILPTNNFARIQDMQVTFTPLTGVTPVTYGLGPKGIQELFETEYGRMNAIMSLEIPNTTGVNQTTLPYYYVDPPTELLVPTTNPATVPAGTAAGGDGIQIWKFTHNGVDSHAVHFHMFNVQILNRVGWDGAIRPPDANELGWKETVRMNPLEDCILALRAVMPTNQPFKMPNSVRKMNVARPVGSTMGFTGVDPAGLPAAVTNQYINFGHEYVYHCHLLGHEENDMMRAIAVAVSPEAPSALAFTTQTSPLRVNLSWTNNALTASGFTIQRATNAGFTTGLTTFTTPGLVTTYTDTTAVAGTPYFYRVLANNTVGDTAVYAAPTLGYPSLTVSSAPSGTVIVGPPAAPSLVTMTGGGVGVAIVVHWRDNANNEINFTVARATAAGGPWTNQTTTSPAVAGTGGNGSYTDNRGVPGRTYWYQVQATNAFGASAWAVSALSITKA